MAKHENVESKIQHSTPMVIQKHTVTYDDKGPDKRQRIGIEYPNVVERLNVALEIMSDPVHDFPEAFVVVCRAYDAIVIEHAQDVKNMLGGKTKKDGSIVTPVATDDEISTWLAKVTLLDSMSETDKDRALIQQHLSPEERKALADHERMVNESAAAIRLLKSGARKKATKGTDNMKATG